MRASDYQALIGGVDTLDLEEKGKQVVRDFIRRMARAQGISGLEREERVEFASGLLARKVQRSVICARLMAIFKISRSQAYVDITEALQLSSKSPQNWTK